MCVVSIKRGGGGDASPGNSSKGPATKTLSAAAQGRKKAYHIAVLHYVALIDLDAFCHDNYGHITGKAKLLDELARGLLSIKALYEGEALSAFRQVVSQHREEPYFDIHLCPTSVE